MKTLYWTELSERSFLPVFFDENCIPFIKTIVRGGSSVMSMKCYSSIGIVDGNMIIIGNQQYPLDEVQIINSEVPKNKVDLPRAYFEDVDNTISK